MRNSAQSGFAASTILTVLVIILALAASGIYLVKYRTSDVKIGSKGETRQALVDHYKPGTCYGMPPGQPEPDIDLKRSSKGWQYTVYDGDCCNITEYSGVITISEIKETDVNHTETAC